MTVNDPPAEQPIGLNEPSAEKILPAGATSLPGQDPLRKDLEAIMLENALEVAVAGHVNISSPTITAMGKKLQETLTSLPGIDMTELTLPTDFHITLIPSVDFKPVVNILADQVRQSPPKEKMNRDAVFSEARNRIRAMLTLQGIDQQWAIRGIGMAESGENIAYFAVVRWDGGRELRKRLAAYGIKPDSQDFHITLAVKNKDVFGVRKNLVRWTAEGKPVAAPAEEKK